MFAVGARASELPLNQHPPSIVGIGGKITLPRTRKPRRQMFRMLPYVAIPGYSPICLDSNDPHTVQLAFEQRLMRKTPSPDPVFLQRFVKFVDTWLQDHMSAVHVMSFTEWLDTTSYDLNRKKQLTEAFDSLRGGLPSKRQCSHIDTFVKSEFYMEFKHARMINSRHDLFKVISGPAFKSIEHALYSLPWFVKHVAVKDRALAIEKLRRCWLHYYASDYTAFESHFTPYFMNLCELRLYRYCLTKYPQLSSLICKTIAGPNKMRTRTGVRAQVLGRRMSGDMCTSLGNTFTNLMLFAFLVHTKGGHFDGFVEGDDGIFGTDVPITSADFSRLGFTIKIEEHPDPRLASFCGQLFDDPNQIIRDPRKFFLGFGWTQSFINGGPRLMHELLHAKALSALFETPHCPIVAPLAQLALKHTLSYSPRFVQDGYHVTRPAKLEEFNPSVGTRELFARKFNIPITVQLAIEEAIRNEDLVLVSTLLPPTEAQSVYTDHYVEIA